MEESQQNNEVFELYGKFLVNFEHVSHLMRFTILYCIFPNASEKETRKNEILLESLTADQIRNKFLALITEDFKSDTELFKLSKAISMVYERMIPIRNSFAHGTSFIGASSIMKESKDGALLLRHPKLRKEGLDLNFRKYEISSLKSGIQLFERLRYAVGVVNVTIMSKHTNKIYADGYNPDQHLESLRLELIRLEEKLKILFKK